MDIVQGISWILEKLISISEQNAQELLTAVERAARVP